MIHPIFIAKFNLFVNIKTYFSGKDQECFLNSFRQWFIKYSSQKFTSRKNLLITIWILIAQYGLL